MTPILNLTGGWVLAQSPEGRTLLGRSGAFGATLYMLDAMRFSGGLLDWWCNDALTWVARNQAHEHRAIVEGFMMMIERHGETHSMEVAA